MSKRGATIRRTDTNQSEIVRALREVGASVQTIHTIGGGCPDLLVGFRGDNYVLEVKFGTGKLSPDETDWFSRWQGQRAIVRDVDEALSAIGAG